MERLTGPLADALGRQRELFNARFANARRLCSTLDADAFFDHLTQTLDPIIRAVVRTLPETAEGATLSLYDLSLELFVARLLGPEAKTPWIAAVWRELLPVAAAQMAREPGRLAACASNAVVNLAATTGARPREWLDRMIAIAGKCPDTTAMLDCGKVLAWQVGMAQYRGGALCTVGTLRPELAAAALGLPPGTNADDIGRVTERLKADPWLTSIAALRGADAPSPLRIVGQAGAFRGFGGPFIRPPTVAQSSGAIYALDGEGVWQLAADAYGVNLIRTERRDFSPAGSDGATIGRNGDVRWGTDHVRFPNLEHATSLAGDEHTLAVTLPTSHHVFLLARSAEN